METNNSVLPLLVATPAAASGYMNQFVSYLEHDCPLISVWLTHINKDLDPRTSDWLLMSSALSPLTIIVLYLLAVSVGRQMLESVQFNDARILRILEFYNITLVILNGSLGAMFSWWTYVGNYSYFCQPVGRNSTGVDMRIAELVYYFFISKVLELFDSLFHVVRKKYNQLTFLHVYHHSSMVFATWIGVRYVPGGSVAIIAMINSWVHVLMYAYYLVSVCLKSNILNRFMNYKKFVTTMQITQFCFTVLVCVSSLINGCDFPSWVAYCLIFYMLGFITLFINFVCQMYL